MVILLMKRRSIKGYLGPIAGLSRDYLQIIFGKPLFWKAYFWSGWGARKPHLGAKVGSGLSRDYLWTISRLSAGYLWKASFLESVFLERLGR